MPFVAIIAWALFGIQEIGKQGTRPVTIVLISTTDVDRVFCLIAVPHYTSSMFRITFTAGMMIEEPFQRALKLEVFANTIRRDLSDLLHVSDICPVPLNITSEALGK